MADVRIPIWRRVALHCLRVTVVYRETSLSCLKGACILTCNHVSLLDGVIVALASPVPLDFAVSPRFAVDVKATRYGMAVLASLGLGRVVPLSSMRNLFGMRVLLKSLRAGRAVMIFPTGTIREDATELSGYRWLQDRSGCKVVSASIKGAERCRFFSSKGDRLFPKIEVVI